MIPVIWKYAAIAVVAAGAVTGIYVKGRSDGKAVVQAVLDEQRATWQAEYDRQAADTLVKEASWAARLKEQERGLQAKLVAAESSVGSLARRLRLASRSGQCAVSDDTASAGDATGSSGIASSIGRLEQGAWDAAARDSARLTECQIAYGAISGG